jgi:hypothetical protein
MRLEVLSLIGSKLGSSEPQGLLELDTLPAGGSARLGYVKVLNVDRCRMYMYTPCADRGYCIGKRIGNGWIGCCAVQTQDLPRRICWCYYYHHFVNDTMVKRLAGS